MNEQTEAPEDPENAEQEWVSKSQLKRDSKALQELGKKLSHYNDEQLARIPLTDELHQALLLTRRIDNKRGALKRHYQFVGKLLRNIPVDDILAAVATLDSNEQAHKQLFKEMEYWRDHIVAEQTTGSDEFCNRFPSADRQKLRQLARNLKQANDDAKRKRLARQIFQEVQQTLLAENQQKSL